LLIDSLTSGGAQRQLCMLAVGLAERGHEVSLLTYHPHDFYDYLLEGRVPIQRLAPHRKWQRPWLLRRAIRRHRPDVVIAFLQASCLYAELAALPWKRFKLIVGERNLDLKPTRFFRLKTQMHRIADAVVCNSHAQTEMIRTHAPWLWKKLHTVVNAIDLERFRPLDREEYLARDPDRVRFLTLGRFSAQKNGENLLRGFAEACRRSDKHLTLDWFGNRFLNEDGSPSPRTAEFDKLADLSRELGIADRVTLGDPVSEVEKLYPQYDAFILASKHEGCPNVLVEAMACGLPVLASRVADHEWIVGKGKDGWLFDPDSVAAISERLSEPLKLPREKAFAIGSEGADRVARLFDANEVINHYERIGM